MSAEVLMTTAVEKMMRDIDVPEVPLERLRRRIHRESALAHRWKYLAAIAAAIVAVVLPKIAPGVTQSIEEQIEAVLRWTPPPPAPAWVESSLRGEAGSLAAAQSRARFTIAPPQGLPKDVVRQKIVTIPTGVYSYATHHWSVGAPAVWFVYDRQDGREFTLLADRFDSREGPPSSHMFLDAGTRNGREILIPHEKFTWRNGDQVMSAVAGEGLTADEIRAIRTAMHGIAVTGTLPRATIVKQYRFP